MIATYPFTVESFETDFQRQIKPFALQGRLQELTYRASAAGGAGYAVLRERGLFWALNRMHIVVDRWPVWGEEMVLQSWFRGRSGPTHQLTDIQAGYYREIHPGGQVDFTHC